MRNTILLMAALALLLLAGCPANDATTGGDTDTADTPADQGGQGAGGGTTAAAWGDAPDINFTSYSGSQHKLSDFVGKPLVINFWAEW